MEPSSAKPSVPSGSSYLPLKTLWLCSLLLILSVQFWMLNETQRMASSQALLRVHLPSLRDSEVKETGDREVAQTPGAPLDEEGIPRKGSRAQVPIQRDVREAGAAPRGGALDQAQSLHLTAAHAAGHHFTCALLGEFEE
ncbi:hypothetical protein Gpo141_00006143 [Globisporangium polare]